MAEKFRITLELTEADVRALEYMVNEHKVDGVVARVAAEARRQMKLPTARAVVHLGGDYTGGK